MTYGDILEHYGAGSLTKAARALRLPISTVAAWRTDGVPFGRQCQIQLLTGGALKAVEPKRRRLPA